MNAESIHKRRGAFERVTTIAAVIFAALPYLVHWTESLRLESVSIDKAWYPYIAVVIVLVLSAAAEYFKYVEKFRRADVTA